MLIRLTFIGALLLFLLGFFPINLEPNSMTNLESVKGPTHAPPLHTWHHRLIFVVIDALRADFIWNDQGYFPFVNQLVRQGKAYGFTAEAQAPTVTMPRIKALTAGVSPAFVDVLLNFASTQIEYETWLDGLRGPVEFYGDDTWIRLFPHRFARSEGVTSFYVSDYVEVDQNVTRNLHARLPDLKKDAVLILHYLGLDHIGHLAGPDSHLVPEKLAEMDAMIKVVFDILESDDYVVIVGDHGMSAVGSHGGSSLAETMVPIVLASPAFGSGGKIDQLVQQVDLVPTICMLLDLKPWPRDSVGIPLLPAVLEARGAGTTERDILRQAWEHLCLKSTGHRLCDLAPTETITM